MKWPKGKYNGKKIDGFKVSISFHFLTWFWKPITSRNYGQPYFIWLFVTLRAEPNYK